VPSHNEILGASILIVDDQEANVLLLEELLRSVGYCQLRSTSNPFEVCDLHLEHQYDIILLDLQMPGMDGFAVMEGLKKVEPSGYTPLLAITVQPGHKLRALSSGAKDFIAKPFDLVEVTTRIHNMLEVRLLYKRLAQSVKDLESMALHDALTGLPNRRLLMDRLRQAVGVSARTGDYGALMFLDLDHFKALNDTLGHIEGDHLLQQVGVRLQACVRDGDSVARLGGDEFVILLAALSRNAHHASLQAAAIARKILAAIQQTSRLKEANTHVSASIGVTLFVGNVCSPEELLRRADHAMYEAKAAGRNTVSFFDLSQADISGSDQDGSGTGT